MKGGGLKAEGGGELCYGLPVRRALTLVNINSDGRKLFWLCLSVIWQSGIRLGLSDTDLGCFPRLFDTQHLDDDCHCRLSTIERASEKEAVCRSGMSSGTAPD